MSTESTIVPYNHDHENEIIPFAETNFRNQGRRFGIKTDDRRRHFYVLGKTGMGKTTMLENMVIADILAGHGVGVVDPHGDFAEKILDFIPTNRINDVVYFNPADYEFPIGFNILEAVDDQTKPLVAAGLMGVFKKIWPDVWSARMEHILNNCIGSLLDFPGSTLLGINRLLTDKEYNKRVQAKIKDPVTRAFWTQEFWRWEDRFRNEAIAPIQNKVGQFLSSAVIRNIVAQVQSTINIRQIMDNRQIFIMNLAKGRIGEDSSRLLGGMLITKIQLSAMERVNLAEKDRQDYYLYVDEFQNFATQSFANILSEARKYRLNLIIAHQYIEQLDEDYVRPAVFGNVGTIVTFRVGAKDAEFMEQEFMPQFTPEDLVNLGKYDVYLKLMIDGVASQPFSAKTMSPIGNRTGNLDKVIKVSRERYATPRVDIEEKILKWSGFEEQAGGELVSTRAEAPSDAPKSKWPAKRAAAPRQEEWKPPARAAAPSSSPAPSPVASSAAAKPAADVAPRPATARTAAASPAGEKRGKVAVVVDCSRCGKQVSVGFKPDPSRPFYCDECFKIIKAERETAKQAGGAAPSPSSRRDAPEAPARPNPPRIVTDVPDSQVFDNDV